MLADDIELGYATYLNGNQIDREQLYGEIMLHVIGWDAQVFTDKTDVINLNIYSDGNVKDSRFYINIVSYILSRGYYD